jgi:hypothetical protein
MSGVVPVSAARERARTRVEMTLRIGGRTVHFVFRDPRPPRSRPELLLVAALNVLIGVGMHARRRVRSRRVRLVARWFQHRVICGGRGWRSFRRSVPPATQQDA